MHPERPQQKSESYLRLRDAIFASERSSLDEGLLPMFDAENSACYHHFLEMLPEDFDDTLDEAKDGDTDAIKTLATSYRTFRENLEADLSENDPSSYEAFIGAVALANAPLAQTVLENYFSTIPLGEADELPDALID